MNLGKLGVWASLDALSATDAWLLGRITDTGPVRLSALADWQEVDRSTMTTQVRRLERLGLVVNLVPRVAEFAREVRLEESVPTHHRERMGRPGLREDDRAVRRMLKEALRGELPEAVGGGGGAHAEALGEGGHGDGVGVPLAETPQGLEVVLRAWREVADVGQAQLSMPQRVERYSAAFCAACGAASLAAVTSSAL